MENKKDLKEKKISYLDITIFLIVIIIFGLGLLALYPGLITSDGVDQLSQAITGEYIDAHPPLHSLIVGGLYKLFGSISAIGVFQIILFAIIWTIALKKLREINNSGVNKAFQILFTILVCFIPVNFAYSITVWKDILYSYSMLGTVILIFIGIRNNYNYSIFQMILISISLVLIMKIRHNGLPIGIVLIAILLILNFVKNKKLKKVGIFASIFVVTLAMLNIPEWIIKPQKQLDTASALTGQAVYYMGGILNQDIELSQEEEEFLNKIIPLDIWKENFNPYTGVPLLFNEHYMQNKKFLSENSDKFMEIFIKYAKDNMGSVLSTFIEVNSIMWSIDERNGFTNSFDTNNDYIEEMSGGIYHTTPKSEFLNDFYTGIVDLTKNNKILYHLFYRPATAMYLSIILIAYITIKNRKWDYILLVFPMLLNIGTYLFFISSPDLRYYYPNFLTCYFLIALFAAMKLKINIVKKPIDKKEKNNGKTLVIVPAYNEQGAIKKTVDEIKKCNSNCDVLVVNDGSKDNTLEEARKTSAIVLDLPSNLGIGGAVQTGYRYALKNNYDIAIQIDGDGQHNPEYISKMQDLIVNEGYDMVIGSRFVEKTSYKQTFFRMLGINITSGIISGMTGVKIHDTTSGYRAVNREIIEYFSNNYPYDYPEPDTNMQMIIKGMNIKEIPVEMNQRETGVSSISPLKSISYMLKVTLSLIVTGIRKL